MNIYIDEAGQSARLDSGTVSYVLEVVDGKYLVHRYFGPSLRRWHGCGTPVYYKRAYSTAHDCSVPNVSFDDFPFEYPARGRGDFRIPSLQVQRQDGISVVEPLFKSWRVLEGKPGIPGLPSVFQGDTDAATLELPARSYEFLSLYGTHAKEANRSRFALHSGIRKIESVCGSSSPQHQPFFALLSPGTTETSGEVYAMHLVYSGNFLAQAEVDSFGNVRAQIGIHPEGFAWRLEPGGHFATPEAILNYGGSGLNSMSHGFHRLYREHLMPRHFAETMRPVLLNSWESMYYDVSMDKIETQAALAARAGMELFVLDDGWFRADNSSSSSMGDWQCNLEKLPGGIRRAAGIVHGKGLKFGLWFEPEAVCKNSLLYRKHPEWVLHIPGYEPVEGRHEYLLDLGRQEVQDYLVGVLDSYLGSGDVDYIKWDMNRPLTDVCSLALGPEQKGETAHRYILGLYEVLHRVTSAYPGVLIEGCSSGGARFDPGMLYYVAQNWASDNTDAFDRTVIQDGFSLLYPPVATGAHVSITPNHQTGRYTPLDTRYQIARLFNLGYELDLTKCSEEELEMIAGQIAEHKGERAWMQGGIFSRQEAPNRNYMVWSVMGPDRSQCQVMVFQKFYDPLCCHGRFRIQYLDPDTSYLETGSGQIYGGDELMQIGFTVPLVKEDFHAFTFHFRRLDTEKMPPVNSNQFRSGILKRGLNPPPDCVIF